MDTQDSRLRDISHATTDLHDALIRRDFDAAHRALDTGASPTAGYNFRDVRACFLQGGRDLGDPVSMRCSPLCLALGATNRSGSGGDRSARPVKDEPGLKLMIERLLTLGADPNDCGNECQDDGSGGYFDPNQTFSPLQLARDRGVSSEIVAVLESAGATICAQEAQNEQRRQSQIEAAKKRRDESARRQKEQKPPATFSSAQVLASYEFQDLGAHMAAQSEATADDHGVATKSDGPSGSRLSTSATEESFLQKLLDTAAQLCYLHQSLPMMG